MIQYPLQLRFSLLRDRNELTMYQMWLSRCGFPDYNVGISKEELRLYQLEYFVVTMLLEKEG
jgi:hypothetical protein